MPAPAAHRSYLLAPLIVGAFTSIALRPRAAFAEERLEKELRDQRKPIYDDPTPPLPPPTRISPAPSTPTNDSNKPPRQPTESNERGPTPTDRLASQIGRARLALYQQSLDAEKSLNTFMRRAFAMERDFTQTVASLAPPADSNEAVMPGVIYVLVATLAGSIVTRNRGIMLRTVVPLAFGTTAAYAALPLTMHNAGRLVERYESRYPQIQRVHSQMSEQTRYAWETGKAHTAMTIQRGESILDEARRKMEDWVRQGK